MGPGLADPVDVESPWATEEIPDAHMVYMRVPNHAITELDGDIVPASALFKNFGDGAGVPGMSTDWCRYSSPHETRMRATSKPPDSYAVISLVVAKVRTIPKQRVQHTPIFIEPRHPENNRAHTDAFGPKSDKELGRIEREAAGHTEGSAALTLLEQEILSIRLKREATAIRNMFQAYASWEILPGAPLGSANQRHRVCQAD